MAVGQAKPPIGSERMAEEAASSEAGSTIAGRYTLVRHLATGGMAELYLARLGSIGGFQKDVVIKRIHPRFADHAKITKLFLDEARIAATLAHPNILNVLDVGEENGTLFIVMEYIRGENLWTIARRGVEAHRFLPLPHALRIVATVCEGLHYVHTRKGPDGRPLEIVHRDVSPSNIVVSADGVAKLVDFGIARWALRSFDDRSLVTGKPNYMAPEQLRGQQVDARADVFALGIVLWEMTVQKRLFRGKPDEVTRRILEEDVPRPSEVMAGYPPELEQIVMHALEKSPEARWETCAELHDALETFAIDHKLRASSIAIGLFVRDLFAMRTQPSYQDLEDARAWGEEDEIEIEEDLDFDRAEAESAPLGGAAPKGAPALRAGRIGTPPPPIPAPPAPQPAAQAPQAAPANPPVSAESGSDPALVIDPPPETASFGVERPGPSSSGRQVALSASGSRPALTTSGRQVTSLPIQTVGGAATEGRKSTPPPGNSGRQSAAPPGRTSRPPMDARKVPLRPRSRTPLLVVLALVVAAAAAFAWTALHK